ncbi:MAG: MFS transporter [Planctomycetota bacterium]
MDRTPSPRSLWLVMIPLGLPIFMINIDVTVVNLALPQIAAEMHTSLDDIQWVVNGYLIASAAMVVFGGRLADMLGRRRVFIAAVVVFVASSAAAGLAQRPYQLIISRIVQGAGMAAYPISLALLYFSFPGERRNLAIGIVMSIAWSSAAMGPTLGGIVLHVLDWRWVFLINIPPGVVAVITAMMWIRESEPEADCRMDYFGQALLSIGLFAVLFALNEGQTWGYGSARFVSVLVGGLAALGMLVGVERTVKAPLLDPKFFRNRCFLSANLVRALFQYVCFGMMFLVSLYVQNILYHTPLAAGLMMLWFTATSGVVSPLAGKWIDRAGARFPVTAGLLLIAVSCGLFSTASSATTLWSLAPPLALFGLGASAVISGCASTVLSAVPQSKAGVASGVLYMNAALGGAVGIAVTGLIIHLRATAFMAGRLAAQAIALSPAQHDWINKTVTGAHSVQRLLTELPSQIAGPVISDVRDAFVSGFALNMQFYLALSIIAMAIAWTAMPAGKHREDERE